MSESLGQLDDKEVISRILQGDANAFSVLLDRYEGRVFAIVRKHVPPDQVEEVTQDVFIRAFKGLSGLNNGTSFGAWVSSISTNTCCDFWRKQYKKKEVPLSGLSLRHREWLDGVLADESDKKFEQARKKKEAAEILDWALAQLSPKDRMVMELVYLEGWSGKEAAKELGWSTANVKVRCYRAKKKIEKLLLKKSGP